MFLRSLLLVMVAVAVAGNRSRSRYRPPGWRDPSQEVAQPVPQSRPKQTSVVAREPSRPRESTRKLARPKESVRQPARPRVRATSPAPRTRFRDYDYADYEDYSDYEYRPQTTTRPRNLRKPVNRRVNRVTTPAPRSRYDYEDYSNYEEQRPPSRNRLSTLSPFSTRGRSVQYSAQEQALDSERRREETEQRNRLFLQNKEKYCSPSDFPAEDLLSSQEDPGLITVTHTFGNGLWGLGASTLELVPVELLKSTDISASPLIYYSASTGSQAIVYSGLVADTKLEVVVRPTCVLGRSTEVQDVVTRNQYTVRPVTQQLLLPGLDQPDLTQLLLSLLAKDMVGSSPLLRPALPSVSTSLVTNLATLSSTYLTTLTETDTTLISLTFRGKEVVSTLTSTSTRELTATEFSTSTVITTALVTANAFQPLTLQSTAAPLAANTDAPAMTYLETRTSTILRTSTQEQTTAIPITFRGQKIFTTLTNSIVVTLTESQLHTETKTRSPAPAPATPELEVLAPLLADLGLSYEDLDLDLVSLLLDPAGPPPLTTTALPDLGDWGRPGQDLPQDLWDDIILSGKNF